MYVLQDFRKNSEEWFMTGTRFCSRAGIQIREVNHFPASNRISCTLALHEPLQKHEVCTRIPLCANFAFKRGAILQSELRTSCRWIDRTALLCDKIWTPICDVRFFFSSPVIGLLLTGLIRRRRERRETAK